LSIIVASNPRIIRDNAVCQIKPIPFICALCHVWGSVAWVHWWIVWLEELRIAGYAAYMYVHTASALSRFPSRNFPATAVVAPYGRLGFFLPLFETPFIFLEWVKLEGQRNADTLHLSPWNMKFEKIISFERRVPNASHSSWTYSRTKNPRKKI